MRVLPSGPGVANHRLSGLPGARSAKAPKTEATELESELPLSAVSRHSRGTGSGGENVPLTDLGQIRLVAEFGREADLRLWRGYPA